MVYRVVQVVVAVDLVAHQLVDQQQITLAPHNKGIRVVVAVVLQQLIDQVEVEVQAE
jgi:hypothetical protein